jgi:hypothetical protein
LRTLYSKETSQTWSACEIQRTGHKEQETQLTKMQASMHNHNYTTLQTRKDLCLNNLTALQNSFHTLRILSPALRLTSPKGLSQ